MEYLAIPQQDKRQCIMSNVQLPDGSSSSEKMLMWNAEYDSGFSTRVPSVSSRSPDRGDDDLLDGFDEVDSVSIVSSFPIAQSRQQQQQQLLLPPSQSTTASAVANDIDDESDEDNYIASWMHSKDNLEIALKAVPELLALLNDEDKYIMQQASHCLYFMANMETSRLALLQTARVMPCIVDCLTKTSDVETVNNLMRALYGMTHHRPDGVAKLRACPQLVVLLLQLLAAPIESIVSYSINIVHNVLIESDDVTKTELCPLVLHHLVPLLQRECSSENAKFLSIVVDCLNKLVPGNKEAKMIMLEMSATQTLVTMLCVQNYPKLILNILILLKALSSCVHNKQVLISINAIPPLSDHLMTSSAQCAANMRLTTPNPALYIWHQITTNCLKTLRYLSDAATQLPGLQPLVVNLLTFLSSPQDPNHVEMAAEILSNLTTNEANKLAAVRANAIPILLQLVSQYGAVSSTISIPVIVDACLCALRHLTIRHAETYQAQEQFCMYNGLSLVAFIMGNKKQAARNWAITKPLLGVVRNFATNTFNAEHMRHNQIILNLLNVMYEAFSIMHQKITAGLAVNDIKLNGVNLNEIFDLSAACLLLLAKDDQNKPIFLSLDTVRFFVDMLYSPIGGVQRAGASILAELVASSECALAVERWPRFNEYVQANFCNQFGQLSINQSSASSTHTQVLQYIKTILDKLQEHKRAFY